MKELETQANKKAMQSKEAYVKPAIEIIEMQHESNILVGSATDWSDGGGNNPGGW